MPPPKQEMDFERVPGEVEQNFEDSFYRALHRRVVLVSGARRCERLLWGPWRPGSTQASGDLKKLEAAHESDAKVAVKLLSVAKALHAGAPPRQDHRGISYGELFRKCPEGMEVFEVEAETFQSPSSSRLQTRYKCICYLLDDVRRAGGAKLIEVTGCFQENREKAEADGQAILEAYASGGMPEARQMQRQIMAGMWGTLSAPSAEAEEAPEEEGQVGAYSQPELKAPKSVTIRPARPPLGPRGTKPLSPARPSVPKTPPKAAPKSVKAVPKPAAPRTGSMEPKATSSVKAVPTKSKIWPPSARSEGKEGKAPPRLEPKEPDGPPPGWKVKEPDGPPPGWKAPAQETSSRTVTEAKRTGPTRMTSTVVKLSPAGQAPRRVLQPTTKASGRPETGKNRGEPDKDGEPDKKSKVPVQKGKAFSKGKEKSSVKAVKAEEDFHDATDEEKDLDNGKGRSKVAKAKGKGSKGKDKGSSEKVERVETKETKGKGGKSGKGKSGSGKSGKGGKAKSRESREKDFTEEKQETSKDDSNEAAKDRGSMAETSMDHFGNIGDVWKLL